MIHLKSVGLKRKKKEKNKEEVAPLDTSLQQECCIFCDMAFRGWQKDGPYFMNPSEIAQASSRLRGRGPHHLKGKRQRIMKDDQMVSSRQEYNIKAILNQNSEHQL